MTPTNALTVAVLSFLRLRGCFAWRQNNLRVPGRSFNGVKGIPDVVGVAPDGRFIGVEIKTGTDTQSEAQRAFQSEIERRSARYYVIRNTAEIVAVLEAVGRTPRGSSEKRQH